MISYASNTQSASLRLVKAEKVKKRVTIKEEPRARSEERHPVSWDIEEKGPVQMISYASDTESGSLRLIKSEKIKKRVTIVEEDKTEISKASQSAVQKTKVTQKQVRPGPNESELEDGAVQMISYASDTESASLRLIKSETIAERSVRVKLLIEPSPC